MHWLDGSSALLLVGSGAIGLVFRFLRPAMWLGTLLLAGLLTGWFARPVAEAIEGPTVTFQGVRVVARIVFLIALVALIVIRKSLARQYWRDATPEALAQWEANKKWDHLAGGVLAMVLAAVFWGFTVLLLALDGPEPLQNKMQGSQTVRLAQRHLGDTLQKYWPAHQQDLQGAFSPNLQVPPTPPTSVSPGTWTPPTSLPGQLPEAKKAAMTDAPK